MFGIPEAVTSVSTLVTTIISRIWPDASEQEKAKLALLSQELDAELKLLLAQAEVNRIEAGHSSIFVAGARPFILWVCGFALAYVSIIEPVARFITTVFFDYTGLFPEINTDITLQVLLGLLGLSGMRSFEKSKHIARSKL